MSLNLLNSTIPSIPVDEVVTNIQKTEAQNIFVVYCIYFVGFLILSFLLDRSGCFDGWVGRLGGHAHKSFLRYERKYLKSKGKTNPVEEIHDVPKQGGCCPRANHAIVPEETIVEEVKKPRSCLCKLPCCAFGRFLCNTAEGEEYNPLFLKKLLAASPYFGIPDDNVCCWPFCTGGLTADFLFYLFNHHSVLAMLGCSPQNQFSRHERKIAFYVQHCMAFFFASLIIYLNPSPMTKIMLNVLVITPITLLVNTSYYYLLACPCLIHEWEWAASLICVKFLNVLGKWIAYPVALLSFGFLIISAGLNINSEEGSIDMVVRYCYQVHVVSIFMDLFFASLLFRKNTFTEYKICGTTVFAIGGWFKEHIDIFGLVKDEHYTTHTCTIIPCIFKVVTLKRIPGVIRPLPITAGDIESVSMQSMDSNKPVETNPPIDAGERGDGGSKVAPAPGYVPFEMETPSNKDWVPVRRTSGGANDANGQPIAVAVPTNESNKGTASGTPATAGTQASSNAMSVKSDISVTSTGSLPVTNAVIPPSTMASSGAIDTTLGVSSSVAAVVDVNVSVQPSPEKTSQAPNTK